MGYEEQALGQEITREEVISVGLTAVLVSDARKRTAFYLRNVSTGGEKISVQLSNITIPVDNTGIVLKADDFIMDNNSEGYQCWTGKITAICNGAGGKLSVFER